MADDKKVISLTEAIKQKDNKEKELEMYRKHLSMIEDRMAFLEMDRKVTLDIINMIETEQVILVGYTEESEDSDQ